MLLSARLLANKFDIMASNDKKKELNSLNLSLRSICKFIESLLFVSQSSWLDLLFYLTDNR